MIVNILYPFATHSRDEQTQNSVMLFGRLILEIFCSGILFIPCVETKFRR
jgi:hypothetical protein